MLLKLSVDESGVIFAEQVPSGFNFVNIQWGFQLYTDEGCFTLLESPGQHLKSEMILALTEVDGGNKLLGRASIPFASKLNEFSDDPQARIYPQSEFEQPAKWAENLINQELFGDKWKSVMDN